MSIRRLIGFTFVATLFIPAGAHAFPSGAPYPGADDYGSCSSTLELLSFCSHDEHAKGATGAVDVAVSLESRGQGYLPGTGNGISQAMFVVPFSVSEPASAISVRARFHIDEATMTLVRRYGGLGPPASGSIMVTAGLSGNCFGCFGNSVSELLIDATDPEPISDEDFEVTARITACCEEVLQGDFSAQFTLEAYASMNPGFGSIVSTARGTLTETELIVDAA